MCSGGRLLADFVVGTIDQPSGLPNVVARCLTQTVNEEWVIWASKIAWIEGNQFRALGGDSYPADARAECRFNRDHPAPDASCTCGFHAVSDAQEGLPFGVPLPVRGSSVVTAVHAARSTRPMNADTMTPTLLAVALSGRVLSFEWLGDSVLFRAERQTVVWVGSKDSPDVEPDDPTGRMAGVEPRKPIGVGPVRLQLPRESGTVRIADDPGYCIMQTATPALYQEPSRACLSEPPAVGYSSRRDRDLVLLDRSQ